MTVAPGDDEGSAHQEDPNEAGRGWLEPSDAEVDAAFAAIVSGIVADQQPARPALPPGAERHPSAGGPPPDPGRPRSETSEERARRRELRRLERAAEVAAFAAEQAQVEAERAADEAHFTPPEPPPLPRPKGRTIGALLMIIGGIVLLVRPAILAIGQDLTMVLALLLILGGAVLLLTGIWRRRAHGDADGWDDGAVV